MKLLKKTLVAAGIATAVFATGAAQAATINNPSTANPATAGKTITNESVLTVITPTATVVTLEAGESLSIDDSVTFTLSAGTFGTIAGGNLTSAIGIVNGLETYALVSGGAGSSSATFRVTGQPSAAAAVLTLTGHTITGTGLAANSTIMVTVDMSGFVGGAPTALYGTPITQINTQSEPAMTAAVVPSGVVGTFDVATGFATLTQGANGTGVVTGTSSVFNGTAIVETTASPGANAGITTQVGVGAPLDVPTPAATLLTISGPMNGVAAISGTNVTAALASGAAATPAAPGLFTIDSVNNAAYAQQTLTAASTIGITFDGTIAYDVSSYSVAVSRSPDVVGGYAANANIGGGQLFSFDRNGTAFASNSVGRLSTLTITDRSNNLGAGGANGDIAITAYDQAGNMVACGAGLVIDNLSGNSTVTIQGADIVDNCPGVKRVEGIVNSTAIYVTNTKKSSTGLTQMSGSIGGTQVDI